MTHGKDVVTFYNKSLCFQILDTFWNFITVVSLSVVLWILAAPCILYLVKKTNNSDLLFPSGNIEWKHKAILLIDKCPGFQNRFQREVKDPTLHWKVEFSAVKGMLSCCSAFRDGCSNKFQNVCYFSAHFHLRSVYQVSIWLTQNL